MCGSQTHRRVARTPGAGARTLAGPVRPWLAEDMTAAWMWARSELRARWRAWIVLGMLAGATFGLAAAGVAGARRTAVAVPRYVVASHVPTAAVLANDPSYDAAERAAVAALPEVRQALPFEVAIGVELKPSAGDGGGVDSGVGAGRHPSRRRDHQRTRGRPVAAPTRS